ncbi:hypothetical protein FKM82_016812 [Ascaphus truei]
MKEVGEGLQDQMNCMMGALQELKLLQVQAALEQLEISGAQNQVYSVGQNQCCRNGREAFEVRKESSQRAEKPTTGVRNPDNRLLAFSQGFQAVSSLNSSMPESWATTESQFTGVDFESQHPMDVTIVLSDQEKYIDEPVPDEAKDWTSSLMSQSRNRQPLVLGDNIFADLVGNWLDLPELEKKGGKTDNILSISRSQEIYKKFSLTANFFKKFLRSVRPDRDKLLKEKPGWLQAEDQAAEISKRPKKAKKQNSVFYFPSQSDIKSTHSKAEKRGKKEEKCNATRRTCTTEGQKPKDYVHTGFDMNTAVWV